MSKFKVGDRVRVLDAEAYFFEAGEIGTVIRIPSLGTPVPMVRVQSDNPSYKDGQWNINGDNLELVEEVKPDTKFQVGDRVEYIGDIEEDSKYITPGVHKIVEMEKNGMYLDYDPTNLWYTTCPDDVFKLVEESVFSEVLPEVIKELKGETAFGDVVISATYSIEVKGVTVVEGLKFEQMYELREALNKIVKL